MKSGGDNYQERNMIHRAYNTKDRAFVNSKDVASSVIGRRLNGKGIPHALWMLEGIIMGYIQGNKAQRWLGYAQAIFVYEDALSLEDCKEINQDNLPCTGHEVRGKVLDREPSDLDQGTLLHGT